MEMERMVIDRKTGEMRPAKKRGPAPGKPRSPRCPPGQVRHQKSKECLPRCDKGETRNSKGNCVEKRVGKVGRPGRSPCPSGEVRRRNGSCGPKQSRRGRPRLYEPCKDGEVRNRKTKECVPKQSGRGRPKKAGSPARRAPSPMMDIPSGFRFFRL